MTEHSDSGEVPAELSDTPARSQGLLEELIGCITPFVVFAVFVFLMMWGYRLMFMDDRPDPIEVGEVQAIELQGGDGKEHEGRDCRVYAEWIAIGADGAVVMIPREQVKTLRLSPAR